MLSESKLYFPYIKINFFSGFLQNCLRISPDIDGFYVAKFIVILFRVILYLKL